MMPPFPSQPAGRARLAFAALAVLVLGAPGLGAAARAPVTTRSDVVYTTTTEGDLALDVYRLKGHTGLPVLMLVHGGSWRRGDKSELERAAVAFARERFLVVAPNYRLAPPGGATIFPGPVDDLRTALRWIRHNARFYGGNPHQVMTVGTSAGAHLSLLLATTGRVRPLAVVLYSPPVDLQRLHAQGVATEAIEAFLGCGPDLCADTYIRASGLFQVDAHTSPVFLVYSTDEVLPVEQGRLLRDRVRELGVRHRSYELEGTAHGLAAGRQVFDETIRFLRRSLNDD